MEGSAPGLADAGVLEVLYHPLVVGSGHLRGTNVHGSLLTEAADAHASLRSQLSPELRASLPVDAQGVTQAIDSCPAPRWRIGLGAWQIRH